MMFTFWNNGNRNGILIRKNQNEEVVMIQQRGTGFIVVLNLYILEVIYNG